MKTTSRPRAEVTAAPAGSRTRATSHDSRRPRLARRPLGTLAAVLLVLAALPATAAAHGPVAPVATAYLARIHSVPRGLQAKVVDGYVRMWLRVPADEQVIVPDYQGAPYLRFDRSGVQENENSEMYYLNEVPAAAIPPADLTRSTPPHWHQVSSGHSYEWHDGRLQALASVALLPRVTDVGVWRVPLSLDGHATAVSGELDHAAGPSIIWFWPIVVLLLCVLAAWRLHDAKLDARLARGIGTVALGAIAVAAVARGLHGRPSVPVFQFVELTVVLAFCAWALRRLATRPGNAVHLAVAFVALWEGLNLIPSLLRHYVLLALPAFVSRADDVVCLAGGLSILVLAFRLADRPGRGGAAEPAVADPARETSEVG
jgi:hypothetical protein